ncbi:MULTISPECIES: hypothetical protein [unclassified Streptomyces]|uniref:hypothetical protein n=1 Tax=unclassified Streptomyces TaxID=2593676 RepID=UPI003817939B
MRRRAVVIGVSAVLVLGLGGTLAARAGGGDGAGYVAVGAAGTGPSAPDRAVPPRGGVELVPLDGAPSGTPDVPGAPGPSGTPGPAGTPPGSGGGPAGSPGPGGRTSATPVAPATRTAPGSANSPAPPGRSASPGPSAPGTSAPTPSSPAVLSLGAPSRSAGDQRWCENVTVQFRNTGGTAVQSGTVTFATHIIGLLGVDWATITSSQALPVPIAAGAVRSQTYGVCVDAWRVPLGMHVETRSVTAGWR